MKSIDSGHAYYHRSAGASIANVRKDAKSTGARNLHIERQITLESFAVDLESYEIDAKLESLHVVKNFQNWNCLLKATGILALAFCDGSANREHRWSGLFLALDTSDH